MDYLTNYYKNLSEDLSRRLTFLEQVAGSTGPETWITGRKAGEPKVSPVGETQEEIPSKEETQPSTPNLALAPTLTPFQKERRQKLMQQEIDREREQNRKKAEEQRKKSEEYARWKLQQNRYSIPPGRPGTEQYGPPSP
jgi:hypothetical protein